MENLDVLDVLDTLDLKDKDEIFDPELYCDDCDDIIYDKDNGTFIVDCFSCSKLC